MSGLKVCVYAICKNEEQFVNRWMDSMGEADAVIVTDTGSSDGTVEALRARGAQVFVEPVNPWRFDEARNRSLSHVPDDANICVCTDLDEVFSPGWRRRLEDAWQAHLTAHPDPAALVGRYLYSWSLKPDGSPDVQFYYQKIHQRADFRWRCPVHEYVAYTGELPVEAVTVEGMVLTHYPDPDKSRGSYLALLELAVKEMPEDTRMRFYLGREYMFKSEWEKAVSTLEGYLAMPAARWNEERSDAMRCIAACCHMLNRNADAFAWFYRAVAECPRVREPYVAFARLCCELRDWPMTYFLARTALDIRERTDTYINSGDCWGATPDDLCAVSAFWLGLREQALEHARRAVELEPGNPRLQENLRIIEAAVRAARPTEHTGQEKQTHQPDTQVYQTQPEQQSEDSDQPDDGSQSAARQTQPPTDAADPPSPDADTSEDDFSA